jgi:hypothetical protein
MKITKIYWGLLALISLVGLVIGVYSTLSYSSNWSDITSGIIRHKPKNTNNGITRVKPDPTTNITGVIRSIDNGSITISTISPDPLTTDEPITRVIYVSPNTKFVAVVAKTPTQIKTDLKKFKSDQKKSAAITPPSPMNEIEVAPSDLKLTMVITAFADNDISVAPSFDASKIAFQTF